MEIYKIAMYFAAVGVIFGSLSYIMDIGDNWFDQDVPSMKEFNISISASESDVEDLQFDGDSGIEDNSIGMMKYGNLLFKLLQGVFCIVSIIAPFLPYDYNGVPIFLPILALFQGLIYMTYIIGALQFISNRHIEGMA